MEPLFFKAADFPPKLQQKMGKKVRFSLGILQNYFTASELHIGTGIVAYDGLQHQNTKLSVTLRC